MNIKYNLFVFYVVSSLLLIVAGGKFLIENVFQSYKDLFFISGGLIFLFSYGFFTHGIQVVLAGPLSFRSNEVQKILALGALGFVIACIVFLVGAALRI